MSSVKNEKNRELSGGFPEQAAQGPTSLAPRALPISFLEQTQRELAASTRPQEEKQSSGIANKQRASISNQTGLASYKRSDLSRVIGKFIDAEDTDSLKAIGPDAVPYLIEAVKKNPSEDLIRALSDIRDRRAIPIFRDTLYSSVASEDERRAALAGIASIHRENPGRLYEEIKHLLSKLSSDNEGASRSLRELATEYAGMSAPDDAAIDSLLKVARDKHNSSENRVLAVKTLAKISTEGFADPAVVRSVQKELYNEFLVSGNKSATNEMRSTLGSIGDQKDAQYLINEIDPPCILGMDKEAAIICLKNAAAFVERGLISKDFLSNALLQVAIAPSAALELRGVALTQLVEQKMTVNSQKLAEMLQDPALPCELRYVSIQAYVASMKEQEFKERTKNISAEDLDCGIRDALISRLNSSGGPEDLNHLRALVVSNNKNIFLGTRLKSIEAIAAISAREGTSASEEALGFLVELLGSKSTSRNLSSRGEIALKNQAIRAIASLLDKDPSVVCKEKINSAVLPMIDVANSDKPLNSFVDEVNIERDSLLLVLAKLTNNKVLPHFLERLQRSDVSGEANGKLAIALIHAIAQCGGREGARRLEELIAGELLSSGLRKEAIRELDIQNTTEGIEALKRFSNSLDENVRLAALAGLARRSDKQAIVELCKMEFSPEAKLDAVKAIAQNRDTLSTSKMMEFLNAPSNDEIRSGLKNIINSSESILNFAENVRELGMATGDRGKASKLLAYSEALKACPEIDILHPLRFFPDSLVEIVKNRKSGLERINHSEKIAACVYARDDSLGSFYRNPGLVDSLIKNGYKVMVYETDRDFSDSPKRQANATRLSFEECLKDSTTIQSTAKRHPADAIVICGHGEKGVTVFGTEDPRLGNVTSGPESIDLLDENKMIYRGLKECLKEGGRIVFFSCSVGKGENREGENDNLMNMFRRVFPHAAKNGVLGGTAPIIAPHIRLIFDLFGRLKDVSLPVREYRADAEGSHSIRAA